MTETAEPTVEAQSAMADYLIRSVIGDATGENEGDRCAGEPPSARYYLGTLAPVDLDLGTSGPRRGRETPNALGFEFDIVDGPCELRFEAGVSCYYRVLPTLEEQLAYGAGSDEESVRRAADYRLTPVFRRCEVHIGPVVVPIAADTALVPDIGRDEFAEGFAGAATAAVTDPMVERRDGDERRERFVPGAALDEAETFEAWLADLRGTPVVPEWAASITVMVRATVPGRRRVVVSLENRSVDPTVVVQGRGRSAGSTRHDDARDHFLFRARLAVGAEAGVLLPIQMDLGPDAYRYDPYLPAYANNCGIEATYRGDALVGIEAVSAPVHTTTRALSREHPATPFAELASDPLPPLRRLGDDLAAYVDDPAWSHPPDLPGHLARRRETDRKAFALEATRFAEGLRWLERDHRLLLAFQLANRAMTRAGELSDQRNAGWRLFQLVFLVSQLPALAWREHPAVEFTPGLWGDPDGQDPTAAATVVFYPTSGGKTEAYLGLIVCCLFYDRLRGKARGVSAWCRFPLRLLTLQQTQRHLDLIAAADEIRDEASAAIRAAGGDIGDRFMVGFFAGEGNTPNSLSRDADQVVRLQSDPAARRRIRVVDVCPYCRERSVEVLPPDATTLRLVHRCSSCGRELPVVVVDTEIYRYLPGVVVGTLDKLANVGLSDRFGALLGDVDCECALHGFGRGGKCQERRATGHPKNLVRPLARPLYDASPTLEIVDELHMVDEELGAFSGHYEGLLAAIQQSLSARGRPDGRGVRMKVVATTATIRGEDRQCEHLFGLESVVCPLPGPSLESSFYWELHHDRPLRRFVGIQPSRATAEMTMVRILTAAHRAIRRVEEGTVPPELIALTGDELAELLDLYRVSLTYVTSLVDFGKLRRSMDTQVNQALTQEGYPPLRVEELRGETPFDDVRSTLDDLQTPVGSIEAVVATSMVSHGVDIDRLNLMLFNGMPRTMAEYIQASSRVGRRHLGIVFMIFNSVRERDRSHFRYHAKFHEYLDRMVAPVAINRWSRFAARRTLPGMLMGEVLQTGNRAWWDVGNAPSHLHDLSKMQRALRPPGAGGLEKVQPDELLEALRIAYLADRPEAAELGRELDERVPRALASVLAAGPGAAAGAGGRFRYRGTADYLGLEHTPMTSLRDVSEGLPFITLSEKRRP
jgi:hypothetical protein